MFQPRKRGVGGASARGPAEGAMVGDGDEGEPGAALDSFPRFVEPIA